MWVHYLPPCACFFITQWGKNGIFFGVLKEIKDLCILLTTSQRKVVSLRPHSMLGEYDLCSPLFCSLRGLESGDTQWRDVLMRVSKDWVCGCVTLSPFQDDYMCTRRLIVSPDEW